MEKVKILLRSIVFVISIYGISFCVLIQHPVGLIGFGVVALITGSKSDIE